VQEKMPTRTCKDADRAYCIWTEVSDVQREPQTLEEWKAAYFIVWKAALRDQKKLAEAMHIVQLLDEGQIGLAKSYAKDLLKGD
jgi:hypothetical protein